MLLAMCCMSHCLQLGKALQSHAHIHFPPSLLLYFFTFPLTVAHLFACSFDFFSLLCIFFLLLSSLLSFLPPVLSFFSVSLCRCKCYATSTFAGTFDIVALPLLVFFYAISYFYINFRLEYMAQCSYCGRNSIRFPSLPFFSHFVPFVLLLNFFFCFAPCLFFFCWSSSSTTTSFVR